MAGAAFLAPLCAKAEPSEPRETAEAAPSPAAEKGVGPSTDRRPLDLPWERRGGFTFGFDVDAIYGGARGYPNDLNRIGDPAWQSHVSGLGTAIHLWVGGTLTDWLSVGVGWAQTRITGDVLDSSGWALLFRVEAFPAYARGGIWRDIGLSADIGTGPVGIVRKADNRELAYAGTVSIIGIGAFWEPWHLGDRRFNAGPFVTWQHQQSDSMTRSFGAVGLRGAFYGAP